MIPIFPPLLARRGVDTNFVLGCMFGSVVRGTINTTAVITLTRRERRGDILTDRWLVRSGGAWRKGKGGAYVMCSINSVIWPTTFIHKGGEGKVFYVASDDQYHLLAPPPFPY